MVCKSYAAQPCVIMLPMMDQVHGRPDGTARKRFNDHKDRLIEGEHVRTREG